MYDADAAREALAEAKRFAKGSGSDEEKAEIKKVVLYARVSTAEQAEKDLSLPAQLGALRRVRTHAGR